MDDDTLTMADASRLSGLAIQTLRNHLKSGTLKGKQIQTATGPRWQIAREDLAEMCRQRYGRELPEEMPERESKAFSQGPVSYVAEGPASDKYATLRALAAGLVAEVERLSREG